MIDINYILYFFVTLLLVVFLYRIINPYLAHKETNIKTISVFHNQSEHVIFLSHIEASMFLFKDNDNYVKNMSAVDLHARKVKSHEEYIQNISDITMSFSQSEKEKILACTKQADEFYKKMKSVIYSNASNDSVSEYYKLLDGERIAGFPWKFGLTHKKDKKDYEDGLPHTRKDIIFLSKEQLVYNDIDLTNTLIHEKLHIYQRYNKVLMQQIIKDMNYAILDMNTLNKNEKELIRCNPDLDGNIYYDRLSNKMMICKYNSTTPKNISDVEISNFSIEHPYEMMAYEIASLFYKENLNTYKNI
jgi:hypothetical protein